MNGFGNWIRRIMVGRYGMDELNRFIMYVALALVIIGLFVHTRIVSWLAVVLLIILYCRAFSRSIYKRQQENVKYLQIKSNFKGNRSSKPQQWKDKQASKQGKRVLICPYCKEKLRVPVGAGTIKIRCPHCGSEFEETV